MARFESSNSQNTVQIALFESAVFECSLQIRMVSKQPLTCRMKSATRPSGFHHFEELVFLESISMVNLQWCNRCMMYVFLLPQVISGLWVGDCFVHDSVQRDGG